MVDIFPGGIACYGSLFGVRLARQRVLQVGNIHDSFETLA